MSLVTSPTQSRTCCAACASRRVTEITMTLTDGTLVDFVSCHACEHRSWSDSGTVLAIHDVLGRTRKIPTQKQPVAARPSARKARKIPA